MRLQKWKKNILSIFFLVFMICLVFVCKPCKALETEEKPVKKIILIDPGHGGRDGGAVSKNGVVEKGINLSIGLKLKDKLISQGYTAFMTRETDIGLYDENAKNKKKQDLANRNKMKRDTKCDMFISIHLNMYPKPQYKGAQIWYTNNEESKKFAHIMQENMKKDLNSNNNRVEKPGWKEYRVLEGDETIPSIIVECGFLSNPEDEQKLKTSQYQDKVVESISKSINEYYNIANKVNEN